VALNRTLAQLRSSTRQFADVQGTTALLRHPDADVNDAVCRALGSLHRHLNEAQADQRFLSSASITMVSGTSLYLLASDFDHLISVDLTANGVKTWLVSYENAERPLLTDDSQSFTGVPFLYRLRGSYIEFLPEPTAAHVATVWYVPAPAQPTNDATTYDTINRLDDYVVAYAARIIATKDKNWDLVAECRNVCTELEAEIAVIGRTRDKNSPGRITDSYLSDRWGRHLRSGWGRR
jgi:hypothetical protein